MEPEIHRVEAQNDFLSRLSNVTPVQALSELIWNALDADAKNVTVKFHLDKLQGLAQIDVIDDGYGMSRSDAIKYFKNLGGSWKRTQKRTNVHKRPIHGSNGKGRFMVFSICGKAQWNVVYTQNAKSSKFSAGIDSSDCTIVSVDPESQTSSKKHGVTVSMTDIKSSIDASLLSSEKSIQQITEVFSKYLRTHQDVRIVYDGQVIDHSVMINNVWSVALSPYIDDSGDSHPMRLDVVEWKNKAESLLYLCNESEVPLHMIKLHLNFTNFNITCYLNSSLFGELHNAGTISLIEMDNTFSSVIERVNEEVLRISKRLSAERTQTIVENWKEQKVYPYEGDPETHVEKIERDVFDIVATTVQSISPGLSSVPKEHTALQLRLLRRTIESSPNELSKILNEVLKLSRHHQKILADLLEEVTLVGIIEAASLVTERLKFIDILKHILFDAKAKKLTKERSQLHKLLEQNTWIFGERYNLWASDKELTNVLRIYAKKYNLEIDTGEPVKVSGKSRGIIDLMLSRSLCGHEDDKPEHLVVEIKAPKHTLNRDDLHQIESYAEAIDEDDRFHGIAGLRWHFWLIADRYNKDVKRRIRKGPDSRNSLVLKDERMLVGVKTWAEILEENRSRLEYMKRALEYSADDEQSLNHVREKYGEILKGISFKKDDT